jgi:hypothetical protein
MNKMSSKVTNEVMSFFAPFEQAMNGRLHG